MRSDPTKLVMSALLTGPLGSVHLMLQVNRPDKNELVATDIDDLASFNMLRVQLIVYRLCIGCVLTVY